MSTKKNYITSSCIISNNSVYKNGALVYENMGADLPAFMLSVYQYFGLNYSRFYKMDNLSKLAWLTSEILLKDSFEKGKYKPEEVGLILSNANASLDSDQKYMASVAEIPSPALFVYTLPNIMIGEICIRNNFKGEDAFFVAEQFDANFTARYVSDLLNTDVIKTCICGWVDVLNDNYKSALFLIEKEEKQDAATFNADNMNKIFNGSKTTDNQQVFIAGVGVITAIGNNVAECLASFEKGQAGMGDITMMNTIYRHQLPVAEVKLTNEELAGRTGLLPELSRNMHLSLAAAKEALDDAGISNITDLRTGFVSANSVGGMDKSEDFFYRFFEK